MDEEMKQYLERIKGQSKETVLDEKSTFVIKRYPTYEAKQKPFIESFRDSECADEFYDKYAEHPLVYPSPSPAMDAGDLYAADSQFHEAKKEEFLDRFFEAFCDYYEGNGETDMRKRLFEDAQDYMRHVENSLQNPEKARAAYNVDQQNRFLELREHLSGIDSDWYLNHYLPDSSEIRYKEIPRNPNVTYEYEPEKEQKLDVQKFTFSFQKEQQNKDEIEWD